MQLRPYQDQLLSRIKRGIEQHDSILLQLPTGGGKTLIATELAKAAADRGQVVWFICHRREIIRQTSQALVDAGVVHGFYAPGLDSNVGSPVKVSSVDTLRNWIGELATRPDIVIWDECHHIAAKTWAGLKGKFAGAKHIGLTATPSRLDGVGLGDFFDTLIAGPDTRQLIDRSFLSEYRLFAPTVPDLRGVKVRAGDYARDELSERMSAPTIVGDAIEHYQRLAPGSRAIVFATSVNASKAIAKRFNAANIKAAHVDGTTPTKDRDAAVAELETGAINVLSNVEVFTEGFDLPAIDAVILLRPTRSFALYRQMIGRGLRAAEGKRETVILDHAGLIYQHGLPDETVTWSLEGTARQPAHKTDERTSLRCCPECTSVHVFKTACPECGYIYKLRERMIEEVYGNLVEVRHRPGYLSGSEFARQVDIAQSTVFLLMKSGLPNEMGAIPLKDGVAWLKENWASSPKKPPFGSAHGEYESQADFGKRTGRKKVAKLFAAGMPRALNGWIPVEPALEWLREWESRPRTGVRPPAHSGQESQMAFARRIGVKHWIVLTWVKQGLPVDEHGWVNIDAALAWVAAQPKAKPRVKHDTHRHFAERVGVPAAAAGAFIKRGMPVNEDGSLDVDRAVEWFKTTPINWKGLSNFLPIGFESVKGFARRIGQKNGRHIKKWGCPIEPNGLIDCAKANAWWEENKTGRLEAMYSDEHKKKLSVSCREGRAA